MSRRPASRKRQPLSRERIAQAALDLVDREGLNALSMRKLGAELGVEAMSLYSHFRDKEELLHGVVEAVLAELVAGPGCGTWREQLTHAARSYRAVLGAHPAALPLFATRPLHTPAVMRHIEPAIALLHDAGLTAVECVYALDSITNFIVGHALAQWGHEAHVPPAQRVGEHVRRLSNLPPSDFPTIAALLPGMAKFDYDGSFEFGLDLLFEGLTARLRGDGPR